MIAKRLSIAAALGLIGCADPASIEGPIGEATSAITVAEAASAGCSTVSVKGLSDQIIAAAACAEPGAFVEVKPPANLTFGAAVVPYLEEPARAALLDALAEAPGTAMTVNSMLRTVAQQYLLYTWFQGGMCGIALAATPGTSNHETGLALDVEEHATWQSTLEAHGFAWLGASDPVHFDYAGPDAVDYRGADVLAFQKLWNQNHPEDIIDEDGLYGPQTNARLEQSPAEGFPKGITCAAPGPDIHPAITILGAGDTFDDGASSGAVDLFEGDAYAIAITIQNKGSAPASDVTVGIAIPSPHLAALDYRIETDFEHPGVFVESDANTLPQNPSHGGSLGASIALDLSALSPGETKRVSMTLRAAEYSPGKADDLAASVWVEDVPGVYHQDALGEDPSIAVGQTFGQRLEASARADVYSRRRWLWDSDRREGWSPGGNATLTLQQGALVVSGQTPTIVGPTTIAFPASLGGLVLRAKRQGGSGEGRVSFGTASDPALSDATKLTFELPDDGDYHTISIDGANDPRWEGEITALAIAPFASGSGKVWIDSLEAGQGDGSTESAGCSCRVSGDENPYFGPISLGILALLTLGVRRRCGIFWKRTTPSMVGSSRVSRCRLRLISS